MLGIDTYRLKTRWNALRKLYTLEEIESQIQNRATYASDLVYPDYVKMFADGGPFSARPPSTTTTTNEPKTSEGLDDVPVPR